jgi:LysR family glycine cleavage system transcriptional activator
MAINRSKSVTPPLHWLRAYEASARHLSFTNAAAELFITQSAVSKQVRLLESHLGQQLFTRERRGLNLTEAGRNYLPTIIRAFNTLDQGTRTFLGYSTEKNLHIKANYSFSVFWLSSHLHEFMERYPEAELTVSTALWEQDFTTSNADVEIHYGKRDWFSDQTIQLAEERIYPVCSPEIASRLTVPADMANERILDLTGVSDSWDYWASQTGNAGLEIKQRHYFSTFALSLNMARESRGISLGQSTLVESAIERGDLVCPFELAADGRDHYFLLQDIVDTPHPYAARFIDWIVEKFQGQLTSSQLTSS